jgi:hypothetical protein
VWVPRGEGEGGPGEQQWAAAVGLFADAADVEVPVLPPGEIAESFLRFVHYQADDAVALLLLLAVLGLVVERVVPFLVGNALPIGAGLAALAAVVLADRLTRPWFIEAESGRLVDPPRRIWRVSGWWRARRAFRVVVDAVAEGRIDSRYGVIVFTDRSAAP